MFAEPGEIEAQLLQHPQVKEAVVRVCEDEPGKPQLVACVAAQVRSSMRLAEGAADSALVERWNRLYEVTYSNGPAGPSFVGWRSSYTRQPIPEEQMQEWLGAILKRIRALKPQRVLEIGCGVGLLLQHLAPDCPMYVGTDFSAAALSQLQQWIHSRKDLGHVGLVHRSATELEDFGVGEFDTIVLNSVVQYFPDIEYLLTVLREAARILGPDRHIFIGDVRHVGLLPMFHSTVQLSRATDSTTVGQLRRRITRALAQETELAIDPRFFYALPGNVPGISAVEVQLKRGTAPNELTRYRYDVVLRTGPEVASPPAYERLDWRAAVGSTTQLYLELRRRRWRSVCLSAIPNRRLAAEELAQRLIETGDEQMSVRELRETLTGLQFEETDPERFWSYAETCAYDVAVSWSSHELPECFDVHLSDPAYADGRYCAMPQPVIALEPWASYANDPRENSLRQQLIPQLRGYLRERLPEHAIPSDWTVVERMPPTFHRDGQQRAP